MTVFRLNSGDLFLHSPEKLNDSLALQLEYLGKVKYLVTLNKIHHLHLTYYIDKYLNAEVWGSPGLVKKRSDVKFSGEFDSKCSLLWMVK